MSSILNSELLALWDRHYPKGADVFLPMAYPDAEQDGLVVVGINPSFSLRDLERLRRRWTEAAIEPSSFFHWRNRHAYDLSTAARFEAYARTTLPFYSKHRQLSSMCALAWEHLDLFAIRHPKQSDILPSLVGDTNSPCPTDFAAAQLRLFFARLERAAPRVVLVANAYASRLYLSERPMRFNHRLGTYTDKLAERTVPVFLSGMLSGKRALDVFSRERLFWQVVASAHRDSKSAARKALI